MDDDRKWLEPGENFRKAKRATLSFCAIGFLLAWARTDVILPIAMFGGTVTLPTAGIELALAIYCGYLMIAFDHEYHRQFLIHSEQLYAKNFAGLMDQLKSLEEQIAQYFKSMHEAAIAANQVKGSVEAVRQRPPQVSIQTMEISNKIREWRDGAIAKGHVDGTEYYKVTAQDFQDGVNVLADSIKEITREAQRQLGYAFLGVIGQVDVYGELPTDIPPKRDEALAAIAKIGSNIGQLSSKFTPRERRIFTYYDGWATYIFFIISELALLCDIVEKVRS